MPKFRDYFRQMIEENQELFAEFAETHGKYQQDKQEWQEEFNRKGEKVMEVVREWEGRLCGHQEKGDKAVFSAGLAEKFWSEVKAFFPLIDFVGVEVVKKGKPPKVANVTQVEKEDNAKVDMDPDMWEIDKITLTSVETFDIKRIKF